MSKQHREFLLREQLKVIRKELGMEKDEKESLVDKFTKKLEKFPAIPAEVKKVIDEELEKLDYGLEMAKLQKEIDKKVEDAKSTYESSKHSIAELRQKLKRADADFRNLTESYAAAKENFEAASSRIDDIRKRLAKAGAIVP
jgi:chromosome segregation ATPase